MSDSGNDQEISTQSMSETNSPAPQEGLEHSSFTENPKLLNTVDSPVNIKGNYLGIKNIFDPHPL